MFADRPAGMPFHMTTGGPPVQTGNLGNNKGSGP